MGAGTFEKREEGMSEGRGFESPNYTQVPNDLFDRLKEFEKADLKVLLAVIRATFGYHRDRAKITTREMATLTGLSVASVQPAAEKLEKMGLIEQIKDGKAVTTWRAVVAADSMIGTRKKKRDSTIDTSVIQPLVHADSTIGTPQSSLKKGKEREIKVIDDNFKFIQNTMESNSIGMNSQAAQLISEWLAEHDKDWIEKAIKDNPGKHQNYIDKILVNWKANGYPKARTQKIADAKEPTSRRRISGL